MMRRKLLCCLLCCLLTLSLCACGGEQSPPPEPTAEPTEAPAAPEVEPSAEPESRPQRQPVLPGASLHAAGEPESEDLTAALVADAQRFVDGPVEALIAALGEPLSRDYAPSCLGSGRDGELCYEGFTVYTYLDDEGETVTGVE